jgi:hypothetical protein
MGDSWAAGAHILAHPALIDRAPASVQEYVIPCDSDSLDSLDTLIALLAVEPKGRRIHDKLVQISESVLQRWVGRMK